MAAGGHKAPATASSTSSCEPLSYPSASSSAVTSCGSRSSLVTEKALNCPASERANRRSVSLSDTRERHVPPIHHDVDRRIPARGVVPEVGIPVDRAGNDVPQPVVEPRHRKHGDLVDHRGHAFERVDALPDGLRLVFRGDVAGEHDVSLAGNLHVDVVEHREERVTEHGALVPELAGTDRASARRRPPATPTVPPRRVPSVAERFGVYSTECPS